MLKSEAISLLGGSITAAAEAIGITYQAVDKWPEVLPARIADRVQAALWRRANGCVHVHVGSDQDGAESMAEAT